MADSELLYKGRRIIAVKPVDATDFGDLDEFGHMASKQALDIIIVTEEGFKKYLKLLSPDPNAVYEK